MERGYFWGKCCRRVIREYNAIIGLCISMEGVNRGRLGRTLMRVRGRMMQEEDWRRIWKKKIDKRVEKWRESMGAKVTTEWYRIKQYQRKEMYDGNWGVISGSEPEWIAWGYKWENTPLGGERRNM